ncbi:hypothetical protein I8H83_04320 [Candidatus Saccharibacteria bacterium]|nr:hypothetical protein [Candidatus Saccharibacteria bacterium]
MAKQNHPKKLKDIKGPIARAELQRAHYIITVLALALTVLVALNIVEPVQFDALLGSIASALLIVVAGVSLVIAVALGRLK